MVMPSLDAVLLVSAGRPGSSAPFSCSGPPAKPSTRASPTRSPGHSEPDLRRHRHDDGRPRRRLKMELRRPADPGRLSRILGTLLLALIVAFANGESGVNPVNCQRSATGHLLQLFRIASPLYLNLRGGGVDFTEIVGREFNGNCPDVLFQPM